MTTQLFAPGEGRLWISGAAEILASQLFRFLIPVFATFLLSASSAQIGVLVSAFNVPVLFVAAILGPVIGRHRTSTVVQLCGSAAALSLVVACGLQLYVGLSYGALLMLCALCGLAYMAFEVGFAVLVTQSVSPDRRLPFNGHLEICQSVMHLLAPASIVAFSSATLCAVALGFLAALMAVAAAACPPSRPAVSRRDNAFFRQLSRGFQFVARDARVRSLTLRLFIWNGVDAAFLTLLFPFWVTNSAVAPGMLAACLALNGVGVVIGALAAPHVLRRLALGSAVLMSMATAAACALLLVVFPPVSWQTALGAFGASLALGCSVAVYRVAHVSLRQALVPDELLAEVTGTMRFVTSLAIPVAPVVAGYAGTAFGNGTALVIAASAALTMALLSAPMSPIRARSS